MKNKLLSKRTSRKSKRYVRKSKPARKSKRTAAARKSKRTAAARKSKRTAAARKSKPARKSKRTAAARKSKPTRKSKRTDVARKSKRSVVRKSKPTRKSKRTSRKKILKSIVKSDDLIFLNVKYDDNFIDTYKDLFQFYIDSDCFKNSQRSESIFDFQKDKSKLYILGKKTKDKNDIFKIKNTKYIPLSFMTILENDGKFTLWNVCTPTEHRNKKYFKQLFNYFLNTINLDVSEVETYVDHKYPENINIYKKLGFDLVETFDSHSLLKLKS
jgi:hypothetical protein